MNKSGLLTKRIPTVVGLLILLGGLVAGIILVNNRQGLATKAGPTESPKNVKITNLGTNNFTVSWTTDTPVTGFLRYSENPGKITSPAGDIRDQISGSSQAYTNHYVDIAGLKASTTYYFLIGSGPQTYNDGGKPFQVTTGPQVVPPPEDVISGKIVTGNNDPVNGGIIYVDIEGGNSMSTVSKTDGTWRLNLASARAKDGTVLTYDKAATLLSMFVQAGANGTATAITNTSKDKPVPDIVMGKNQSFIEALPPLTGEEASAAAQKAGSFQQLANTPSQTVDVNLPSEATGSLQIINPALNGEMIATSSPDFRGMAIPGTDIQITVHSPTEQTQLIKADKDGVWSWTPPQGLDPGVHTLTISYKDENGILQTIERNFTVLAADSGAGLPAFTATPSAVTPTATPSATPFIALTPTPEVVMPATVSSELTKTGAGSYAMLIAGAGIILFLAGQIFKKYIED
ncbi:MAG TPA: Ig-like domain-containing protein [Patescibacteria group bacterium]